MVVRTIFEAESIKDQLALIKSLTSHIDTEKPENIVDINEDYKYMLNKAQKTAENLTEKLKEINKILGN